MKVVNYTPMFTEEIPLLLKEHYEFIQNTAERFRDMGAEVYMVTGMTYYDFVLRQKTKGADKGGIMGFPCFIPRMCQFKNFSKERALHRCVVFIRRNKMCLKYANRLTDEQLKEIYQLFLCEDDKIILLDISRYDDEICLDGKIEIEEEYLKVNPHATLVVDNDYVLSDYNVKIYHHSGNLNEIYRKYMLKTFGADYALDFLFNYLLAN